jgi:hypothetical protein
MHSPQRMNDAREIDVPFIYHVLVFHSNVYFVFCILSYSQVNIVASEKRALDESLQNREKLSAIEEQKAFGYDGELERVKREMAVAVKVSKL